MIGEAAADLIVGIGRPLFSHSRGVSTGPAASTTTFACSVVNAPVRVFRQVTPVARRTIGLDAHGEGVRHKGDAFPRVQRSAVSAIGT